jgi:hypothetical protein
MDYYTDDMRFPCQPDERDNVLIYKELSNNMANLRFKTGAPLYGFFTWLFLSFFFVAYYNSFWEDKKT